MVDQVSNPTAPTTTDFTAVQQADGRTLYQTSDGKQLDAAALVSYVGRRVGSSLDDQLAAKRSQMAAKNQDLTEANNILSKMRDTRPKKSDDEAYLPTGVASWFGANLPESTIPTGKLNQGQWDQLTENIKSKIDEMNATSQTDSIDIDALVKHHDEAYDFLSNYYKLLSQTMQSIINNMRVE